MLYDFLIANISRFFCAAATAAMVGYSRVSIKDSTSKFFSAWKHYVFTAGDYV